jgi:competence protein ComEC
MAHRLPAILASVAAGAATGARAEWRWPTWPTIGGWIVERLLEERERWFLWLPVAIGTGVALYFALPAEPPPWLAAGLLLMAGLGGSTWCYRSAGIGRERALVLSLGLGAVLLGFAVANLRAHLVAAPVLDKRGAYQIEAQVLLVEERVRGQRLLLGTPVIEELDPASTPVTIRVTTRSAEPGFEPGDRLRVRALLMPPSPPVEPGGFDFARYAWFMQLGAVGYALNQPELLSRADSRSWSLALSALRQAIANEITQAVPGDAGAIAVALLTGLRGALPDHIWDQWAIAGIAHLLAISGLHLGLVAGTLFFSARIALALAPPLALRLPAKKLAGLLALIGAFGYLLISGAPIPTQRAFIMTALMLLAVMVDRNPFSMRLVAFAALVVLLLEPETLLGASFQMSFGAVIALIAVYETGVARRPAGAGGLDWRLFMYVAGVALTTLIASAATTPFSIYHFSRFPTYGIVTNLIAVPLTGIWIMPFGMLGLLLIPFGLAGPCFMLMGQGIEIIIAAAAFVAESPGAALNVARPPGAALIVTVLGGLWLCLWRTPWRRLGLIAIVAGMGLGLLGAPADVLVDARGQIFGVRLDDGRIALSPWRRDGWVTEQWLRSAGQADATPWPETGQGSVSGLSCDAVGCVLVRNGRTIALAREPGALEDDCARADLVVTYPRIERCPNGTPMIGPAALRHAGGIALWIGPEEIRTLTVRETRGDRPWVR